MKEFNDIIKQFDTVSIEDVTSINSEVKLLNRTDTKFILPRRKIGNLLQRLLPHYKILEADENRIFRYENLYYDTDDLKFYSAHHNQKLNRYKLRYRQYIDSNLHYWEMKFKNNKKKTIKRRQKQDEAIIELIQRVQDYTNDRLHKGADIDLASVKPILWIHFSRLTLINNELKERITIDTNITFADIKGNKQTLDNLSIAEMKQPHFSLSSPFARAAKAEGIRRANFSKYCAGIHLMLKPEKYGRFKKRLLTMKKIMAG